MLFYLLLYTSSQYYTLKYAMAELVNLHCLRGEDWTTPREQNKKGRPLQ